jgi:hypothetical protein
MARKVRVRERYTADRGRLTRLEEAVEKDPRVNPEEKVRLRELLQELVSLFVSIDNRLHSMPALASTVPAGVPRRRGRDRRARRKAA